MALISTLVHTTHFPQADPLWQDGLSEAVFVPFFACMLVALNHDDGLAWYSDFVQKTQASAAESLQTGQSDAALNAYWTPKHRHMRNKIAQSTFVHDSVLIQALPLAVHTGFTQLRSQALESASSIAQVVARHLSEVLPYLPAWADEVLPTDWLAKTQVEGLLFGQLDKDAGADAANTADCVAEFSVDFSDSADSAIDVSTANQDKKITDLSADNFTNAPATQTHSQTAAQKYTKADTPPLIPKTPLAPPPKPNNRSLLLVGGVLALALIVGGGLLWHHTQAPASSENIAAADQPSNNTATSTELPFLALTVNDTGGLYACHALAGNAELIDSLFHVIHRHFNRALCAMDVDAGMSQQLAGFEQLDSIFGLLKTVPFASLIIKNNAITIHSPNPSDTAILVSDIGALVSMPVSAMQEIDPIAAAKDSVAQARAALSTLSSGASDYQVAQALSLPIIDTTQPLSDDYQKLLPLIAEQIKKRPTLRLILAVHSDAMPDRMMARMQTQNIADAIKQTLIKQGVNADQIVVQGAGDNLPFSDNQTPLGRFLNRRVNFIPYQEHILQVLSQAYNQSPTALNAEQHHSEPTPNYIIINGQIVQQTPEMLAAIAAQEAEASAQAFDPAANAYSHDINFTNHVPSAEPAPPPAPVYESASSENFAMPYDNRSDIPDDLLNPIGSDPARGAPAVRLR